MSGPLAGETRAPTIARIAFGIGVAITWLFFVALVKRTVVGGWKATIPIRFESGYS